MAKSTIPGSKPAEHLHEPEDEDFGPTRAEPSNVLGDRPAGAPPAQTPINPAQPVHAAGSEAKPKPSNGRYRLLAPHVIEGALYEAGTEVGTDTGIPFNVRPSVHMEGVDDAGREEVNKVHQDLYGRDAPWHDEEHPLHHQRRAAEHGRRQAEEEAEAEPVSHQQAWERGHEEYRGDKLRERPGTQPRTNLTKGGDTSEALGPASPRQDPADRDVQTRTATPLKDSMPAEGAAGGGTQQPHKR
jgi:hypothetical protein